MVEGCLQAEVQVSVQQQSLCGLARLARAVPGGSSSLSLREALGKKKPPLRGALRFRHFPHFSWLRRGSVSMLGTWGAIPSQHPKHPVVTVPVPAAPAAVPCSAHSLRGLVPHTGGEVSGTFALFFPEVWYEVTPGGPKDTGLISRALSSVHGT